MQRRLLMNGGPIVGCFPRPPRNHVVQCCNAIDEGVKIIPLNLNLTNAVIKRMSSSCYLLSDSLLLPCMLCFLLLYLQGRFIPIKSFPLVPSRWRSIREKLSFDLSTKMLITFLEFISLIHTYRTWIKMIKASQIILCFIRYSFHQHPSIGR